MTTRIINGVKFDYEVTERTEKELLEIASQDESFDMEDFETPEVKIAVGSYDEEFLNHEVFELDEVHEAVEKYFEEYEENKNVMYVVGDEKDRIYTAFESPDVFKTLKVDKNLMKRRAKEMQALEGNEYEMYIKEYDDGEKVIAFNNHNDGFDSLELDIHHAIGEFDEINGDIGVSLDAYYKPENMTEVLIEDALSHYLTLEVTMEDAEDEMFEVELECEKIEGNETNLLARITNVYWS